MEAHQNQQNASNPTNSGVQQQRPGGSANRRSSRPQSNDNIQARLLRQQVTNLANVANSVPTTSGTQQRSNRSENRPNSGANPFFLQYFAHQPQIQQQIRQPSREPERSYESETDRKIMEIKQIFTERSRRGGLGIPHITCRHSPCICLPPELDRIRTALNLTYNGLMNQ